MRPIRVGPRQVVYENQYQQIYSVLVEFEGFHKTIFVNAPGQRVGLLITRGEEVLLVRQYRLLVNQLAWELPGGKVEAGETPEQAARREGLEEARLRCGTLKPLLYFHPGLDTHDNPTFLFSSNEFEEASAERCEATEVTKRIWLPLGRCLEMIFAREIVDSMTIAALLAHHTLKRNPELYHI